jgi:hypothetical protein
MVESGRSDSLIQTSREVDESVMLCGDLSSPVTSTPNRQPTDTDLPLGRTSRLVRRGSLALVVAVAVNSVLVLLSGLAAIAPDLAHLSYGPVAVLTGAGVVGATVVYAVLARSVRAPDRTFTRVAIAALVLSMLPTAAVVPGEPGATLLGTVVLGVMHVPPAVASIVFLTGRLSRTAPETTGLD